MTKAQANRLECIGFFKGLEKAQEVIKEAGEMQDDPYVVLFNFTRRVKKEWEASLKPSGDTTDLT